MSKKIIATFLISNLLAVGVGVYGGIKYDQSRNAATKTDASANRMQQFGRNGTNGARGNRASGSFTGGEIISKDDQSVIIKLTDGGSKIIFYSTSTQIMKSNAGTTNDLTIGENISANGSANPDGSINAQMIQIRPATAKPTEQ